MVRLAEFLGLSCETLSLANLADPVEFLKEFVPDECSCFVLNPQVVREWVGLDRVPPELIAFLSSRFPYLLVYGLRVEAFDTEMVAALSRGRLKSVEAINAKHPFYAI